MTRIRFQQSLEDLKENLLVMAGLAEQAIQRAIEAYRVRDLSICDLVSRSEIAINRMERDIDQAALDLLAMEQPMAIDLRFILSVIKINADLERVGDAAKSISDRVRHMERMAAVDLPVDIPRMASLAADMVRKSLQSFIEGDAELARTVLTMDDAVDQMNRAAYKTLTKVMEESSHLAPQALNALMICRSLERVADHATNIAEDVIFWVQGDDVRHHKSVAKAAAMRRQRAAPVKPHRSRSSRPRSKRAAAKLCDLLHNASIFAQQKAPSMRGVLHLDLHPERSRRSIASRWICSSSDAGSCRS